MRRCFVRLCLSTSDTTVPTVFASLVTKAPRPSKPSTSVVTEVSVAPKPQPSAPSQQPTSDASKEAFLFRTKWSWDKVSKGVNQVHQQAEAATGQADGQQSDTLEILMPEGLLSVPRQHLAKIFQALKISRHLRFELAIGVRDDRVNGMIIASEEAGNTYTFLVSNHATDEELAAALANIPENLRRHHAVFGIEGAACDFFCDCDWKRDVVADPEPLLLLVVETTLQQLSRLGINDAQVAIFHSPNKLKHSFHLHFRSPTACLHDYTHARSLAYRINEACQPAVAELTRSAMKDPVLDTAIYRNCGQMRMAHQAKSSNATGFLTLYTPHHETLAKHCPSAAELTVPKQIEMTFCVRRATGQLKVAKVVSHTTDRESDGRKIRYEMREAKKANRFEEVLKALRNMPPEFAREYRTWNNIGCALFSFGPEYWDRGLDAWLKLSRMAGDKFDPTACTKRWHGSFKGGSRGTALDLNWRRGYTYIMFTIWGRRLPPIVAAGAMAARRKSAAFKKTGKK